MTPAARKRSKQPTPPAIAAQGNDDWKWLEIVVSIALIIILTPLFLALESQFSSWQNTTVQGAHLGGVFLLGVIASFAGCFALVGGFLLSMTAAWREEQADAHTPLWRMQPFILFVIGRVCGYFVFGGFVGLLGQRLSLTLQGSGILTIALSLIMITLGLKILHIRGPCFCRIPVESRLTRFLRSLSTSRHPIATTLLGALTFFIPCGFTQSVQLLALGSGSFMSGAMIMATFALGSLPALLGIGMVSSLGSGTCGRRIVRFSGVLVIMLGIFTLNNGLTLAGVTKSDMLRVRSRALLSSDPHVTIDASGQQILHLTVTDHGYSPSEFTIAAHKPTWIYAYADKNPVGCTSLLTAPAYGMQTPIMQGYTWLGPINNPTKDFVLACSIGRWKANVRVRS